MPASELSTLIIQSDSDGEEAPMNDSSPIVSCPECGETLGSHAGRNWKYFHRHVLDGPYPNPKPYSCNLVNMAFEIDGKPILGSDEVRFGWVEHIHKHFNRDKYPNQPKEDHGMSDEQLGDVFLDTHYPGGKEAARKERNP